MKVRNGFVSNSSSSSFICEICGEAVVIYDSGLSESDMCQCIAGHIICQDHRSEQQMAQAIQQAKQRMDPDCFDDIDWIDEYPKEACPICQLREVPDYMILKYILHKHGITERGMREEIQRKYKNAEEFHKRIT